MKRNLQRLLLAAVYFMVVAGCNDAGSVHFDSKKGYVDWCNIAANGVIKSKRINGYRLSAKYLHPEFLAYKECKSLSRFEYDSLLNEYSNAMTFLLTIGPDDNSREGDVMKSDVANYKEYSERFVRLNFRLESLVSLFNNNQPERLLTYAFENTYGLTDYRNVYLVFSTTASKQPNTDDGSIILSFDANEFGMGLCHFQFDSDLLTQGISFQLNDDKSENL